VALRTAFLAAGWVVSRAAVVWLLAGPHSWVNGDASYFEQSLDVLRQAGVGHTLVEYPLPAVAVLLVPWLAAAVTGLGYAHLLTTAALATDLAFLALLRWGSGSRWGLPCLAWLLGVPLLGATAFARFDLVPGVLAGAALLLLVRRPGLALVAATVATAVKLWPALLLPGLLAAVRRTRTGLPLVAGVGGGLVLASLLVAGWGRLVSPLTYQADRGLQIESVAATPAMLSWWRDPVSSQVFYAPSHSYEVLGPGVGTLLSLTTGATLLLGLGLLAAWARLVVLVAGGRRLSADGAVWLSLAAVTGFVVTGKVLSPQYLLWLLPMAAAGLAVAGPSRTRLAVWTGLLLVACGLTQLVFPVWYAALSNRYGPVGLTVSLLAARNLVLLALLGAAVAEVVRVLVPGFAADAGPHDPRPVVTARR
jgi:hypothetical protein